MKGDKAQFNSEGYTSMFTYGLKSPNVMDCMSIRLSPIPTQKIILITDPHFRKDLRTYLMPEVLIDSAIKKVKIVRGIAFNYNINQYPYGSFALNYDGSNITISTN
jgi:hypothetical protein